MMYELILNPPGLTTAQYVEFYKTLLSVSGVLFGLAFGGMLFILQSGFTTFTFSRKMFLQVYLHFGRQILYALAFLTTLPFFVLFFPTVGNTQAVSVIYFLFLCLFLNATLDHAKEQGYIITLFSKSLFLQITEEFVLISGILKIEGFSLTFYFFIPLFLS